MVQQMQPLGRSWISAPHSSLALRSKASSHGDFAELIHERGNPTVGFFNKPQIKVAFPEPRKPVTMATRIFISMGLVA
jgi:hypothetical protein